MSGPKPSNPAKKAAALRVCLTVPATSPSVPQNADLAALEQMYLYFAD